MTQVNNNNNRSQERPVRALVLTGYGLNCDYETDYSLTLAGAQSHRVHINEIIADAEAGLSDYHILVFGGGFSWADDHGAGVLMATKLRRHLGDQIRRFVEDGRLVIGICNGFQCLVNMGLLPGFDYVYKERRVALTYNDAGNFINTWVKLRVNQDSPCIFTKGIQTLDLPVRHGEGKIVANDETINALFSNNQVAMQYADERDEQANGAWPMNPNGSIRDIAGICDKSGRIFGLMPHPEAFNHYTNHPDWTRKKEELIRQGKTIATEEGDGIKIFKNAVDYIRATAL